MNASQLHLPFRARLASLFAISVAGRAARTAACREVGESLACAGFGGGASLAALANDPFIRERGLAIASGSSRRAGRVAKVGESAASSAPGAFGDSCGLGGRFVLRAPGLSPSQRKTPNQALQRTGAAVTLAAILRSCPSPPSHIFA